MILQRLVDYYDRLMADAANPMTPFGFSREKISFTVVIDPDGGNPELFDVRIQEGKKSFPQIMVVPDRGGRSGTMLKPNFLWDNTGYVLGRDSKGKPERTRQAFEAFRDFHVTMAETIEDEGLSAVAAFLKAWSPEKFESFTLVKEALDKNIVFRLRGRQQFVHESPAIVRQWKAPADEDEAVITGQSLISGEVGPIARLHPMISGVAGAQTMGAAIASFNLDAFESYGREQTYNAPVSVSDAFKYTTALNRLLESRDRRIQLGDATVVFWADKATRLENFASDIFGDAPPPKEDAPPEDKRRAEEVRLFLSQIKDGYATSEAIDPEDKTRFYVLGLSPNASRISIRFWCDSTVGQMKHRLAQHMNDIELVGAWKSDAPLMTRRIVQATGRAELQNGKFKGYDTGLLSPLLAGAIARAIFIGGPYPKILLSTMLSRLRADRYFAYERIAAIKACLVRNYKLENTVALNVEHPSSAYHCGRLLCLLDYIQGQAIGNVNAGLVKKFYTVASSQPFAIFGRLIALTTKAHLPKLDTDDRPGFSQFCERRLRQILSKIGDKFPKILDLTEQGEFALGFYHEKDELPDTPPRYNSTIDRGEKVRSKSEAIIANILNSLNINYEYERPLSIPGQRLLKPDFTVIGQTPRETVYIEHLGMSDVPGYMERWNTKLSVYKGADILLDSEGGGTGGRLVIFSETKSSGINSAEIREKLKMVFNPD